MMGAERFPMLMVVSSSAAQRTYMTFLPAPVGDKLHWYWSTTSRLVLEHTHAYNLAAYSIWSQSTQDSWVVLDISSSWILSYSGNNSTLNCSTLYHDDHDIIVDIVLFCTSIVFEITIILHWADVDTDTAITRWALRSYCNLPLTAVTYDHRALEESTLMSGTNQQRTVAVLGWDQGCLSTESPNRCLV